MKLSQVLDGVEGVLADYDGDIDITSIEYDSRRAGEGSLFAALAGEHTNGNDYVPKAVEQGAGFILSDVIDKDIAVGQICVDAPRVALRKVSENFYCKPEIRLDLIAITGTNGKTTIAQIIAHVLTKFTKKRGVLGTVEYDLCSEVIPAPLTTPESPDYQRYLQQMVSSGAEYAVCEFSSQALAQQRVAGDNVDFAVFTNLSRDHLDNHGSMENYFLAKKMLFDRLMPESYAVINSGDEYAERIVEDCRAKIVRVGYNEDDNFRIMSAEFGVRQTRLEILIDGVEYSVGSALIGEYNATNLLEAIAVLHAAGFGLAEIFAAVSDFSGAGGRLERIEGSDGRVAFVDYAHTGDALDNALSVLRKITAGRLIVVFGCGGDRDRGKRPLMAQAAQKHADYVVITNDNPRTEDPVQIMNDILTGISDDKNVTVEYDRACAIRIGLEMAGKDDVVLVAGKGHEDYQILGNEKIHFDDREVVAAVLAG